MFFIDQGPTTSYYTGPSDSYDGAYKYLEATDLDDWAAVELISDFLPVGQFIYSCHFFEKCKQKIAPPQKK